MPTPQVQSTVRWRGRRSVRPPKVDMGNEGTGRLSALLHYNKRHAHQREVGVSHIVLTMRKLMAADRVQRKGKPIVVGEERDVALGSVLCSLFCVLFRL